MTNPDFARRLAAAKAEMLAAGMKPMAANPPMLWLTALAGLSVRPPHYQGFLGNVVLHGVFFGVFWGVAMHYLVWHAQSLPLLGQIIASTLAGVLFGAMMAAMVRWQSKRRGLSRWQDL